MFFNPHSMHRTDRGFSLIEIMIGVVVGMLGIVVIMQVFLVSEGQKRLTPNAKVRVLPQGAPAAN